MPWVSAGVVFPDLAGNAPFVIHPTFSGIESTLEISVEEISGISSLLDDGRDQSVALIEVQCDPWPIAVSTLGSGCYSESAAGCCGPLVARSDWFDAVATTGRHHRPGSPKLTFLRKPPEPDWAAGEFDLVIQRHLLSRKLADGPRG